MKQLRRHFVISLMVCLISLFITTPVMAIPSLPSSFYGEVRVNGKGLPDGSVVRALIDGQAYAKGYTQTYLGRSVYILDIPADDTATTILEGGREGDTVHFEVAGVLAAQSSIWHSGTNVSLDLTASVIDALIVTQAAPSPVPTQTPMVLVQLSPADPTSVQPIFTATAYAQPVFTSTVIGQLLPTITTSSQSSQESVAIRQLSIVSTPILPSTSIPAASLDLEENVPSYPTLTITFAAMVIVIGGSFWLARKKLSIITKLSRSKQHKTRGGL